MRSIQVRDVWEPDALSPLAVAWLSRRWQCWPSPAGADSGPRGAGGLRSRPREGAVASQGHAAVMPCLTVECPPAVGMGEGWATRRPRSTAVLVSPGMLGPRLGG